MKAEEIAQRYAGERSGFDLVDYAEVGLPCWRIRARCEVLDRKAISAIDEAVLKAVHLGVAGPGDIGRLLGLEDLVLDATIVEMVSSEWVRERGREALVLTDAGREVLDAASQIVTREQVVPFDFDGLLRRPVLVEEALEPRALAAQGIREIPPSPSKKPDLPELRAAGREIRRVLRTLGRTRDQDTELLAIKSVDRRERIFQAAVLLVFRGTGRGDVEIAFVVDEQISAAHEDAFAKAGLAERLGLDRALRRPKAKGPEDLIPKDARTTFDSAREADLRERLRGVERATGASQATSAEKPSRDLEDLRRELQSLPVRTVETYEHPQYLELALRASKNRLLVVSPWITSAVVDRAFRQKLRLLLENGVEVWIGYGMSDDPAGDIPKDVNEELLRLARTYKGFRYAHLGGGTHAKVLVSDSTFAVITSFNWLSFQGDPKRTFRDERGVVLTKQETIDEEWARWQKRWPSTSRRTRRERTGGR